MIFVVQAKNQTGPRSTKQSPNISPMLKHPGTVTHGFHSASDLRLQYTCIFLKISSGTACPNLSFSGLSDVTLSALYRF